MKTILGVTQPKLFTLSREVDRKCCGHGVDLYFENTESILFDGTGTVQNPIVAYVQLSREPNNALVLLGDGLFVDSAAIATITLDSPTIDFSGLGTTMEPLEAEVKISTNPDNILVVDGTGLYVAPPAIPPTPNLQQVTDVGNETDNFIFLADGYDPLNPVIPTFPEDKLIVGNFGNRGYIIAGYLPDQTVNLFPLQITAQELWMTGEDYFQLYSNTDGDIGVGGVGTLDVTGAGALNLSSSNTITLNSYTNKSVIVRDGGTFIPTPQAVLFQVLKASPTSTPITGTIVAYFGGRVRGENAQNTDEYVTLQQLNAIPGQVNADWNATSGVAQILNKPNVILNQTTQQPSSNAYLSGYFAASAARFGGGFPIGDYALSVTSLPSSLNVAANFDGKVQGHDAEFNNEFVTKGQVDGQTFYTADGTLTSDRTVTGDFNLLKFVFGSAQTEWSFAGFSHLVSGFSTSGHLTISDSGVMIGTGDGTILTNYVSTTNFGVDIYAGSISPKISFANGYISLPDYIDSVGDQVLSTDSGGNLILKTIPPSMTPVIDVTSLTAATITVAYMDTNYPTLEITNRVYFTNISDDATKVVVVTKLDVGQYSVNVDTKLT